jgi:multiple sugar transport system permease protein
LTLTAVNVPPRAPGGLSRHLNGLARAKNGVGVGGGGALASRPRRRSLSRRAVLWLFVLPSVVFVSLVYGYPLIYAGFQSTHNGSLLNAGSFVGGANFTADLNNPQFWQSAEFTLVFCVVGVFGSWIVGFALALLLRQRVHAKGLFKTLLLLPWIVPVVVSSTAWNWLVATPGSPVPTIAHDLGLGTMLFLDQPGLAKILVCVFKVWLSFPFMMLMASAALAGVDNELYEAARVDGATAWQQLRRITLPVIARSTYISWVLMFIFCIGDFQSIYLLTGGGPVNATTTLVVLSYLTVFNNFQTGPGVAIGFMMTIVSVIVALGLFHQIRRVRVS